MEAPKDPGGGGRGSRPRRLIRVKTGVFQAGALSAPRAWPTLRGMSERLDKLASELGQMLAEQSLTLATAESCTGGWVAKVVTDIPGSSAWFDRGFVTYGDLAKQEMLGVSAATLDAEGAVSEAVVREMALGALSRSRAQVALAISGIAGPAGGSEDKPVGTVWFAWALHGALRGIGPGGDEPRTEIRAQLLQFAGDREEVRHQSVRVALERLLELLPRVLPQVLPDSRPAPTQAGG